MLHAYQVVDGRLARLDPRAGLGQAIWIDLLCPDADEAARVEALGVSVPSLAEMEEIEVSNRLYRDGGADFITVVLPAHSPEAQATSGPVTFILTASHLITVRHHAPRPFETFPDRAERTNSGCASAARLFLGLCEEIVGRLADLLEGCGRALDRISRDAYDTSAGHQAMHDALLGVGRQGELLSRIELGLMTMQRALGHFALGPEAVAGGKETSTLVDGLLRDMKALEDHSGFLENRVALITGTTLGLINHSQSVTTRILSVVAVLFLPPTLIASIYGMNFRVMPELDRAWGYPMALALMLVSAVGTYLIFKWRKWM